MRKILMLDGSYEFIGNNLEFQNLIRDHVGEDAEEMIRELVSEADYASQRISTDLECYESSLDSWSSAGGEILDIVDRLTEYMEESQRLDRNTLLKGLGKIKSIICDEM